MSAVRAATFTSLCASAFRAQRKHQRSPGAQFTSSKRCCANPGEAEMNFTRGGRVYRATVGQRIWLQDEQQTLMPGIGFAHATFRSLCRSQELN